MIVTAVDSFVVASVQLVCCLAESNGDMSNNCPSKYNSKNLSVPNATYLLPELSINGCWLLTTPTMLLSTRDDQPPTFSGKPYLKRTLSLSIQRFSAPLVVFCLSIPGKILKSIRAI